MDENELLAEKPKMDFGNSRWPCTTRPSENRSGEPIENYLATESRRPLSGQNRNQNTCPRLIRRNGFPIRKNPRCGTVRWPNHIEAIW